MNKVLICLVILVLLIGCSSADKKVVVAEKTGAIITSSGDLTVNCYDSDGGKILDVKGTVSGTSDGGSFEETDTCVGDFLVEYYCENGDKTNDNIRCDNTCIDGACS
jgi:uncharacterized protein YceK